MESYCKVLIVEDELLLRQGMKHMMNWEEEGFTVIAEASNGKEAIDMIEVHHPHIIILDIVMPVMDGVELSRYVQETYPEIQIIILSSYDKFEYVKATLINGAIDYILKPTLNVEQLLGALHKAVSRISGFELDKEMHTDIRSKMEKYLLGYESELSAEDIKELQKILPHDNFLLMASNLSKSCRDKKEISKIQYEMEAGIKQSDMESFSILLKEESLLVILNYRTGQDKSTERFIKELVGGIRSGGGMLHFVISEKFYQINELKRLYEKMMPAVESIFYLKDVCLYRIEQNRSQEQPQRFDYDAYSGCLTSRKYGEGMVRLKNYLTESVTCRVDEYRIKNTAKNLLYNLLIQMESNKYEIEDTHHNFMKKIDEVKYASDFLELLDEIELKINQILSSSSVTENIQINEILRYIKEHYSEPLDLAEIAEVFRFNYFYLSSYFNKELKEGFSEYLNRIRIKRACELLETTNKSIAQISEYVGYSEQGYFSRVFKKITGQTPSVYRKSLYGKEK